MTTPLMTVVTISFGSELVTTWTCVNRNPYGENQSVVDNVLGNTAATTLLGHIQRRLLTQLWIILICGHSLTGIAMFDSKMTTTRIPVDQIIEFWTFSRHHMLSWYRTREAVASSMLVFRHVPGKINSSDILSNNWDYKEIWPTVCRSIRVSKGEWQDLNENEYARLIPPKLGLKSWCLLTRMHLSDGFLNHDNYQKHTHNPHHTFTWSIYLTRLISDVPCRYPFYLRIWLDENILYSRTRPHEILGSSFDIGITELLILHDQKGHWGICFLSNHLPFDLLCSHYKHSCMTESYRSRATARTTR